MVSLTLFYKYVLFLHTYLGLLPPDQNSPFNNKSNYYKTNLAINNNYKFYNQLKKI